MVAIARKPTLEVAELITRKEIYLCVSCHKSSIYDRQLHDGEDVIKHGDAWLIYRIAGGGAHLKSSKRALSNRNEVVARIFDGWSGLNAVLQKSQLHEKLANRTLPGCA